ncbi:restriction endonuclease subunit S [Kribbella sp. CA-294648]|uniref:restriction endonuclease subunit S n=1 Tax=Kribbella sp. CA-294648 TaxID=3239948 RepID=UPI003D9203C9
MHNASAMDAIPGWRRYELGQVARRITRKNRVGNNNILTISAKHGLVSQEEYFRRRVASSDASAYFLLERGDFAYNKSYSDGFPAGVIRRLERYDSGVVSPLYICFRPLGELVDSTFLSHYLDSGIVNDDILWIAKEGVRNHGLLNVKVEDFFSIQIQLPSLSQQQRIATILETLDSCIHGSERLVAKLEMMKSGLLDSLFSFEEWPLKRISEICTITSGTTPPRSEASRYFATQGVPWVKTLDLNEGLICETEERVTPAAISHMRLKILPEGTVLVAMYGGWEQVGRTAMLAIPAAVNQAISALVPTSDIVPEFLLRALQQRRPHWRPVAASTRKDPNITKDDVHAFLVPTPPIETQERIARVYALHLTRIAAELRIRDKLINMKLGLRKDLLTGRVGVSEAETALNDL